MQERFKLGAQLIYPDNSDLDWLTRRSKLKPTRLDQLLRSRKAFLTFSLVHVLEIGRLGSPERRKQRADWLDEVARKRWLISPQKVVTLELDAAFKKIGFLGITPQRRVHYRTSRESLARNLGTGTEGFRTMMDLIQEDPSMVSQFSGPYERYPANREIARRIRRGKPVPREGNIAYLRKVYPRSIPNRAWDELIIEELPGTALAFTINDVLNRRRDRPSSSDLADTQQLRYVPYVHVFCSDKRMATFVKQSPLVPPELKKRIKRSLKSVLGL